MWYGDGILREYIPVNYTCTCIVVCTHYMYSHMPRDVVVLHVPGMHFSQCQEVCHGT